MDDHTFDLNSTAIFHLMTLILMTFVVCNAHFKQLSYDICFDDLCRIGIFCTGIFVMAFVVMAFVAMASVVMAFVVMVFV